MCPRSIYSYSLRQTIFSLLRSLTVLSGTTLDLTYEVAPDVPDILIGNSSYLREVIHILVNNAIKSTPSFDAQIRGHVSLSTRLIAYDDENVVLEFCVMDTGLGVTKDFLDLFLGTKGFFLPICERYVTTSLHGQMWVESEVLKGSTFFFTVQSQINPTCSMERPIEDVFSYANNRKILFVNTVPDVSGIADKISELGFVVYHHRINNAMADMEPVDVIVADSLSAIEYIHDHKCLRRIPIVLLTNPSTPRLNLKWCFDTNIGSEVKMPTTAHELFFGIMSALAISLSVNDTQVGYDILVAEDNLVNQKLFTRILEKYNHKVELAGNGLLALDAFKRRVAQDKPYDIILMDEFMPFIGGVEATTLIRRYEVCHRLKPTPIIGVRGLTDRDPSDNILLSGVDDFLTKPVRRADLLNAINNLMVEGSSK